MKRARQTLAEVSRGFTLVECLVALTIFALATGGVVTLAQYQKEAALQIQSLTRNGAYTAFQAQILALGINPTTVAGVNPLSDYSRTISQSTLNQNFNSAVTVKDGAGRTASGVVRRFASTYRQASAVSNGGTIADSGRGIGIGYSLDLASAGTISTPAIQLLSPGLNYGDDLSSTPFPITNLVNLPAVGNPASGTGNPLGTYYTFTTDGTTPTENSPSWVATTSYTLVNFPARLLIRAFNIDPTYVPSNTVGNSFNYRLSLAYSRVQGGASTSFTLTDLQSPATRGILLISESVPGAAIRYTFSGIDPSPNSGNLYTSGVAPVPAAFVYSAGPPITGTATLRAVAYSTDSRFRPSQQLTTGLAATAVQLPAPTILAASPAIAPTGYAPSGYRFEITHTAGIAGIARAALNSAPIQAATSMNTQAAW